MTPTAANNPPASDSLSRRVDSRIAAAVLGCVVLAVIAGATAMTTTQIATRDEPATPTATVAVVEGGMLGTAAEAQALASSYLPEGYEPTEVVTRLARAGVIESILPGTTAGWDFDTPVWAIIMRTPGLVADQVIPVPVAVTDTHQVVGVVHFLDAPSGLNVAQFPILSEEDYLEYTTIPNEQLVISAATIAPPPTPEP